MHRRLTVIVAFAFPLLLAGCQADESADSGPESEAATEHLEEAGQELQAAAEDATRQMESAAEEAGEQLESTAEEAAKQVEDTCEAVKESAAAADTDC